VRLEKQFDVRRGRDDVVECVVQDATLTGLFPDAESEIVESRGDRRTVRSHYRALGREGTATFHFDFLLDGGVRFEKVCDGRVWRRLVGEVSFEERGTGTRVRIELDGQTKPLVPEFTIKGAMRDQLAQRARALRQRIEAV
jgi:hypothetical protein